MEKQEKKSWNWKSIYVYLGPAEDPALVWRLLLWGLWLCCINFNKRSVWADSKKRENKTKSIYDFFREIKNYSPIWHFFLPKRAAFSRSALVLASSSVCSGTICKLELKRISFFVRLKIKYYGKKSLKKKNRETENYI